MVRKTICLYMAQGATNGRPTHSKQENLPATRYGARRLHLRNYCYPALEHTNGTDLQTDKNLLLLLEPTKQGASVQQLKFGGEIDGWVG